MNEFMSIEIDKLATSLSKAQACLRNVNKERTANHPAQKYKYADLANYFDAIREPLSQNGLSVSQIISQDITDTNKQVLITLLMHESGQWLKSVFNIEIIAHKLMNDLQSLGSAITYVKRYSLSAIIGVTSGDEDDDGASFPVQSNGSRIMEKGKFPPPATTNKISDDKKDVMGLLIKLKDLCESNEIDYISFGKFHNLRSQEPDTIRKAVEGFDGYMDKYHVHLDKKREEKDERNGK